MLTSIKALNVNIMGHFWVDPSLSFWEAIDMKMSFYSHANETHLHKKDFALSLVLKVRVFGTQKWPIWLPTKHLGIQKEFISSLRKQPTFCDATTGFPTKWRLTSILMTRRYLDLGTASDWFNQISYAARPIKSTTTQIWVVTVNQSIPKLPMPYVSSTSSTPRLQPKSLGGSRILSPLLPRLNPLGIPFKIFLAKRDSGKNSNLKTFLNLSSKRTYFVFFFPQVCDSCQKVFAIPKLDPIMRNKQNWATKFMTLSFS